ncbi:MAG: hypothetical protein IKA31_03870 [Clostridia bacterium]|nr:hypothetical protein [Clostridia bacterium]
MSNVPNVNFFIGYAKPQSRKDVRKGENVGTERDFYSSNQTRDYVEYVNSGSKEKIDFIEYSGNKEKSHGIFNADGLMEKSEIKELRNELKQTKSVIWHGVISFTEEFGNTYCDTTEKAIAMMKVEMPKFFRNAGFTPENIKWFAGLHENTDNKHIHFSFFEKSPQRIKIGRTTPIFSDGNIPLRAINDVKSSIEIRLLKLVDDVYSNRNLLTHRIKEKTLLGDYMKHIKLLVGVVPIKGRISYDSENMRVYQPQINKIIRAIIKSDKGVYEKYQEFDRILTKRDNELMRVYSQLKLDFTDKLLRDKCIKDLYRRLGNIVLKNVKQIRKDQLKTERETNNRLVRKHIEKRKRQLLLKRCVQLNEMVNSEIVNSFQDYLRRLEQANYKRLQEEGYLD